MKFNQNFALSLAISGSLILGGCASLQSSHQIENKNSDQLQAPAQIKLSPEKMMSHLKAFQDIAQKNEGNRAVGTKGGWASAKYILDQAKSAGLNPQMLAFENREKTVGQNILVEIAGQSKESVILIGAHYDSVKMGLGINDNATGVATLLEFMHELSQSKQKPKHTIVLAFWDSEEMGIAGSQDYVKKLTQQQLDGIKAYINVDMVGTKSPNIMIADADKSSVNEMEALLKERGMNESDYRPLTDGLRSLPNHAGDLALEQHLKAFFKTKQLTIKEDISTLTASDTLPFLGKVPVTSIILFNEQLKGDELEFAPCYHKACDTIEQVDPQSLEIAGDAIVHLINQIN